MLLRYWHTFWRNTVYMQKIVLISFYLILGKLLLTVGICPFFHDAEDFFDIFTCYVRTSIALFPSEYIKICWKLVKMDHKVFLWQTSSNIKMYQKWGYYTIKNILWVLTGSRDQMKVVRYCSYDTKSSNTKATINYKILENNSSFHVK